MGSRCVKSGVIWPETELQYGGQDHTAVLTGQVPLRTVLAMVDERN